MWDPVAVMQTLRLLDLRTGTDEALPRTGAQYGEGGGVFSPDGSLVAFRGFEASGDRLYVVPADGSAEPRVLTGIAPGEAYVEFAPDGTKVMLDRFPQRDDAAHRRGVGRSGDAPRHGRGSDDLAAARALSWPL